MQDIVLKSRLDISPDAADDEVFDKLNQLASECHAEKNNGARQRVHLILHNQGLVNSLRSNTLSDNISNNVEIYAYTQADIAAMNILGVLGDSVSRLDIRPITYLSDSTVHLVIFGCSAYAESLAVFSSLLCHFPNYCRDERLRTRITWISGSINDFSSFKHKYKGLLDNSYVREIKDTDDGIICKSISFPIYHGKRKDFVDIEWEFVESQPENAAIVYKMDKWSKDENQELTIAFCYDDMNKNLDKAMNLPRSVYELSQVFINSKSTNAIELLKGTDKFHNVFTFGNEDEKDMNFGGFIRMAQCVNYAYCNMREGNSEDSISMMVPIDLPSNKVLQSLWNNPKLTIPKKWSNIYNAITLLPKLRSVGLHPKGWESLVSLQKSDIDILSEVEHNRWCVEELILGFVPTTDEEHERILKDVKERAVLKNKFVHDDLRNYEELGVDETGLSVARYDYGVTKCLPLLAYVYFNLGGDAYEQ